jgi:transcriptional regulator with XRE-family HTH domain
MDMDGKNYEIELVEENAVAHIQAMVLRLLDAKKITRAKLAEKMGVSQAHISQLLGDHPRNLSVKKAARLFHALDEELIMTCAGIDRLNREADDRNAQIEMSLRPVGFDWFESETANSNQSDHHALGELLAA